MIQDDVQLDGYESLEENITNREDFKNESKFLSENQSYFKAIEESKKEA